MNKRLTTYFIATILLVTATSSYAKQITSAKETETKVNDSIITKKKDNSPLYKNLRDINGGEKLKINFNLNSKAPHPNTTKNRNNSKNTIISDHTIKTDFGKTPGVKLAHRN
jgi:hypothetical protein